MTIQTPLDTIEVPKEARRELSYQKAYDYIRTGLSQLASVCDGARSLDGTGFAGMHTGKGRRLAAEMEEGKVLSKEDIRFVRAALPYYHNTQLRWLDCEFLFDCCDVLKEHCEDQEELLQKFENILNAKDDFEITLLFTHIEDEDWPVRSQEFVGSLKKQLNRLSDKQMYWVRKLTIEFLTKNAPKQMAFVREFVKQEEDRAYE